MVARVLIIGGYGNFGSYIARARLLKPRLLIVDEPVSMVDASLRATILETLCNLQRDQGASNIYITHDLTTAYHIAKSIIVLYRGAVVEAGSIDMIIREPRHPNTALLVESIPWPNLDRRWRAQPIKAQEAGGSQSGCQFRTRCPMTMEICAAEPPLFRLDANHTAACFLDDAQPPIALERLSELLPA